MQILTLVVLKESFVDSKTSEHKLFEESIIIFKNENNLNIENKIEFFNYIKKNLDYMEEDYKNQFGELVKWRTIKIIDVFEPSGNLDSLKQFTEVYSRFLEMDRRACCEDVINKYYSDYVWM